MRARRIATLVGLSLLIASGVSAQPEPKPAGTVPPPASTTTAPAPATATTGEPNDRAVAIRAYHDALAQRKLGS